MHFISMDSELRSAVVKGPFLSPWNWLNMTAEAIDGLEGNEDWAKKKTGHIGPVWQLYGLLGSVYTGAGVSEWTSQFFAGTAAHLACLAVDQGIFASDTELFAPRVILTDQLPASFGLNAWCCLRQILIWRCDRCGLLGVFRYVEYVRRLVTLQCMYLYYLVLSCSHLYYLVLSLRVSPQRSANSADAQTPRRSASADRIAIHNMYHIVFPWYFNIYGYIVFNHCHIIITCYHFGTLCQILSICIISKIAAIAGAVCCWGLGFRFPERFVFHPGLAPLRCQRPKTCSRPCHMSRPGTHVSWHRSIQSHRMSQNVTDP
jgi:hypothetical protein